MVTPDRILLPLQDAEPHIDRLTDYRSKEELGESVAAVFDAVDRSLRRLLRSEPAASDDIRMAALTPDALATPRVVEELRRHGMISIELAGGVHELGSAAARVSAGASRAADADLALRCVENLRAEVHSLADRPVRAAAHSVVVDGDVEEEVNAVEPPRRASDARRRIGLAAGLVALAAVLIAVVLLLRGSDSEMEEAVQAFRAGRLGVAEAGFEAVLREEPRNVSALLYLGRVYRRQGRFDEAGQALSRARAAEPQDADVSRELGHLFVQRNRMDLAAKYFQEAVENGPDEAANWIWYVRALRASGNPAADAVFKRAPAEAQAALGG